MVDPKTQGTHDAFDQMKDEKTDKRRSRRTSRDIGLSGRAGVRVSRCRAIQTCAVGWPEAFVVAAREGEGKHDRRQPCAALGRMARTAGAGSGTETAARAANQQGYAPECRSRLSARLLAQPSSRAFMVRKETLSRRTVSAFTVTTKSEATRVRAAHSSPESWTVRRTSNAVGAPSTWMWITTRCASTRALHSGHIS